MQREQATGEARQPPAAQCCENILSHDIERYEWTQFTFGEIFLSYLIPEMQS